MQPISPALRAFTSIKLNKDLPLIGRGKTLPKEIWLYIFKQLMHSTSPLSHLVSYRAINHFFYEACQKIFPFSHDVARLCNYTNRSKYLPLDSSNRELFTGQQAGIEAQWKCAAVGEDGTRYFLNLQDRLLIVNGIDVRFVQFKADIEGATDMPLLDGGGVARIYSCHPIDNGLVLVGTHGVSWWQKDETGAFQYIKSWWAPFVVGDFGDVSWYCKENNTIYVLYSDYDLANGGLLDRVLSIDLSSRESKEMSYLELFATESRVDRQQSRSITYGTRFFYSIPNSGSTSFHLYEAHSRQNKTTGNRQWKKEQSPLIVKDGELLNDCKTIHTPLLFFHAGKYIDIFDLRTHYWLKGSHIGLEYKTDECFFFSEEFIFVFYREKDSGIIQADSWRVFHLPSQTEYTQAFLPYLNPLLKQSTLKEIFSISLDYQTHFSLSLQIVSQTLTGAITLDSLVIKEPKPISPSILRLDASTKRNDIVLKRPEKELFIGHAREGIDWQCAAVREDRTSYFLDNSNHKLLIIKGVDARILDWGADIAGATDLPQRLHGNDIGVIYGCHPINQGVILVGNHGVSWWQEDETGELHYVKSWFSPLLALPEEKSGMDFGTQSWYWKGNNSVYVRYLEPLSDVDTILSINLSSQECAHTAYQELFSRRQYPGQNSSKCIVYDNRFFYNMRTSDHLFKLYESHYQQDTVTGKMQWQRDTLPMITMKGELLFDLPTIHVPLLFFENGKYIDIVDLRTRQILKGENHKLFSKTNESTSMCFVATEDLIFVFYRKDKLQTDSWRVFHLPTQTEYTDAFFPCLNPWLEKNAVKEIFSISLEDKPHSPLVLHILSQHPQGWIFVDAFVFKENQPVFTSNPLLASFPAAVLVTQNPPLTAHLPIKANIPKEIWFKIFSEVLKHSQFQLKDFLACGSTSKFFREICQKTLSLDGVGALLTCINQLKPVKTEKILLYEDASFSNKLYCIAQADDGTRYFRSFSDGYKLIIVKENTVEQLDLTEAVTEEATDIPEKVIGTKHTFYWILGCHPVRNGLVLVSPYCVSFWKQVEGGKRPFQYVASWFGFSEKFPTTIALFNGKFGESSWYDEKRDTIHVCAKGGLIFSVNLSTGVSQYLVRKEIFEPHSGCLRRGCHYFSVGGQFFYSVWRDTGTYEIYRCNYQKDQWGLLDTTGKECWQPDEKPWVADRGHLMTSTQGLDFSTHRDPWVYFYDNPYLNVFDLRSGKYFLKGSECNLLGLAFPYKVFTKEFFCFFGIHPTRQTIKAFRIFHIPTQKECTQLFAPYLKKILKNYTQILSLSLRREMLEGKEVLIIGLIGVEAKGLGISCVSIYVTEEPDDPLGSEDTSTETDRNLDDVLANPYKINLVENIANKLEPDQKPSGTLLPPQNNIVQIEEEKRTPSCSTQAKVILVVATALTLIALTAHLLFFTDWGRHLLGLNPSSPLSPPPMLLQGRF